MTRRAADINGQEPLVARAVRPVKRRRRVSPASDAVARSVAQTVRRYRAERGWTLDELSARCGVSRGLLVAIEQQRANPSIQTLTRVAESFGITLARLVSLADTPPLRVVAAGDGIALWKSTVGSSAHLLIGTAAPARLEFWEWLIEPGDEYVGEPEMLGSVEIVYVHEGTLALTLGEQHVDIGPGDAVLIEPGAPRIFRNRGPGRLRYCQAFAAARAWLEPDQAAER
jgi:transcriptional regulator with XRE-family HTH domain